MKTQPFSGRLRAEIRPSFASTAHRLKARPRPPPVPSTEFLERPEQVVDCLVRQTVAFIQNLEEHALGAGADPQRDGGRRPGEFEGILQEVSHDPREDLSIRVNHHAILDGQHRECDAFGVCLDGCGRREFVDESCHEEWRPILDVLGETDLGERPTQETAYAHEAAIEHGGGAPAGAHVPGLDHFERDDCGVGQILHLMRQEPEAFVPDAPTRRRGWTDCVRARTR